MSFPQPPLQSAIGAVTGKFAQIWQNWITRVQFVLNAITSSGVTSSRPTQNLYVGQNFFDTTLNQTIWWNGSEWIKDAPSTTGVSVLSGDGTGGFTPVTIGTGLFYVGHTLSGTGGTLTTISVATANGFAGTVTAPSSTPVITLETTVSGILKGNGTAISAATAGVDYGTVSSVGLSLPSIFTVSNSPVTSSGTLIGAFNNQSANLVFASPTSGTGQPSFRALTFADTPARAYGQFYDTTNQSASSTTTAYAITCNTPDGHYNVNMSGSQISFASDGEYNIQFSIQFVNTDNNANHNGEIDIWLSKNGSNVPYTNTRFSIPFAHGTANGYGVAALNFFESISAGDYVELYWHTTNTSISMQTLPAATSPTVPVTPSVIITVQQI